MRFPRLARIQWFCYCLNFEWSDAIYFGLGFTTVIRKTFREPGEENLLPNHEDNKENDNEHSNTNTNYNPLPVIVAIWFHWFLCWRCCGRYE